MLSGKLVLSIDTEFVENENEQADKQDCETNAAKRLLNRLRKDYPRLPVCIQADNLYETQPMMELCRKNGYKYIFTHKGTRQKCLDESYELFKESGESTEVKGVCRERGNARFVNHVDRHHNAGISGMESGISGNKAKREKCIFNATRKFSTTESNRRRCTHMFKIHNSIS